MKHLRCVLALVGAVAGAIPCLAASKAYVALCCSTPATISIVDTGTRATVAEFPAAVGAAIIAPTPDHRSMYVLTQLYQGVPGEGWGATPGAVNSIVVMDLSDGRSAATIPLSAMPFAIAFSPSGDLAYVAAVDSSYGAHLVVIDTLTKTVLGDLVSQSYSFGPQVQMVLSPDGSVLYVATYSGAGILKLDARTLQVLAHLDCPGYCQGLALVDHGNTLLTASGGFVEYVDTASLAVTQQLPSPLPPDDYRGWVIPVSSDGATAYFGTDTLSTTPGSLVALDIASGTFGSVLSGMGIFATAAISPNGDYLITDSLPTTLSILSLSAASSGGPRNVITLSDIGSAFFSPGGDRVYVLNAQSSYVAEIDLSTSRVTGTIPAGASPVSLAVEPAGQRLFVANQQSEGLSVVDTAASRVLETFAIPWTGQYTQALAAAGDNIFVADLEALQMLNLETGTFQRLVFPNVGCYPLFEGMAASPGQTQIYMAFRTYSGCATAGTAAAGAVTEGINVYDAATGGLLKQIPVVYATQVAFSPDGTDAYVGGISSGSAFELSVIDTSTQAVVRTIAIPSAQNITSLAVSPSGATIYVLDRPGMVVYAVDVASGSTVASIPVGAHTASLAISPDGSVVYVTAPYRPSLTVVDTATHTVSGTIYVGTGSTAVAFLPE